MAASGSSSLKQVKLEKESELRLEVGYDTPLRLRLLNGSAEIFGSELAPEIWLTFPPRLKFAVRLPDSLSSVSGFALGFRLGIQSPHLFCYVAVLARGSSSC